MSVIQDPFFPLFDSLRIPLGDLCASVGQRTESAKMQDFVNKALAMISNPAHVRFFSDRTWEVLRQHTDGRGFLYGVAPLPPTTLLSVVV